ncbi:hypothetical protein C2G38_2202283 [Gigaspora rosea]|uniref:Galactose oxidase n=1 Tax=Gigaspora rosea TaxID=44941 RepID=A0A397UNZ1_9GLOM|nr:hypothetical protein C2G38_2202283 [Gigaspora rosea]
MFTFFLNFIFTFAAFIPNGRFFHSSVLIDNKLYFSGGYNDSLGIITNEFFYLDVSKPLETTNNSSIQWVDLTYTGGPLKTETTACIGGKNNDIIFIFGGYSHTSQYFVNQFDTSEQQWINIASVGNVPTNRNYTSCANFNNRSIAIFSGYSSINDFWIFNTLTQSWSLGNTTNAPPSRCAYYAITLPDENILYIGGVSGINITVYMPMNNFTSGPTPPVRDSFSAVLTSDERIIIFGGSYETTNLGDLWILDITKFQWSIGNILNPITNLTLQGHTATLVDNYMFVSFGEFSIGNLSSRIFMLDVSRKDSYRWVTEFTPT